MRGWERLGNEPNTLCTTLPTASFRSRPGFLSGRAECTCMPPPVSYQLVGIPQIVRQPFMKHACAKRTCLAKGSKGYTMYPFLQFVNIMQGPCITSSPKPPLYADISKNAGKLLGTSTQTIIFYNNNFRVSLAFRWWARKVHNIVYQAQNFFTCL